ncbi:hypothetical protein GCM10027418_23180 [Mariniluteicoccus endophyticus]
MYSERGDALFFPLWAGIPDDAGVLWWSPGHSPEGWDMWCLARRSPTDLGDGWLGCGAKPQSVAMSHGI